MKHLFFILGVTIFGQACNDKAKNEQVVNTPNDSITVDDSSYTTTDSLTPPPKHQPKPQPPAVTSDPRLTPGKHSFTLHWISWDFPGKVDIQPADNGWYTIRGEQKSRTNSDYVRIDGSIKVVNDTDLLFKGNIESKVETVSNGNVCKKEGEQIFRTRTGRKYWRLQNMNSCEGGTVDYIDIYFN